MKPEEVYLLKFNGNGDGNGDGDGGGDGDGDGNGYGDGDGNGYGNGYGYGYGGGDGDGNGNGYGNGYGYGGGYGNGYGYGGGYGDGYGDGNGYGNGIYIAKIWGEWFEVSDELQNSMCINLPQHLYDKIDKEFLLHVNNLESLRSLREKIGLEKYLSLFDAKIIHEETDGQGNKMKLYKYDEKGTQVILLEVICPSTGRIYHLYPPNQKAKTCVEAKASTFNYEPIFVRHGDVGFVKVGEHYVIPFSET